MRCCVYCMRWLLLLYCTGLLRIGMVCGWDAWAWAWAWALIYRAAHVCMYRCTWYLRPAYWDGRGMVLVMGRRRCFGRWGGVGRSRLEMKMGGRLWMG